MPKLQQWNAGKIWVGGVWTLMFVVQGLEHTGKSSEKIYLGLG